MNVHEASYNYRLALDIEHHHETQYAEAVAARQAAHDDLVAARDREAKQFKAQLARNGQ